MPTHEPLRQAIEYLNAGQFSQAETICAQLVETEPQNAKAWHLYGIACGQREDFEKSVDCLQKSVAIEPGCANYHYNLGFAHQKLGQLDDAIQAYRAAINVKSNSLEARNNLANALIENNDVDEAIECFRELLDQFPESSIGHFNLGNLLQDSGMFEESTTHLQKAIELDPGFSAARENLGRSYSDQQRFDEAVSVWQSWLQHDPDNAIARHHLASITGENTPTRCDDQYVRDTFDENFANSYETQLARLGYAGPDLIAQAIGMIASTRNISTVLDAGCGTGLCAPILRPLASRLVGVDLSADMLAEAAKRELYDEIVEAELTRFLSEHAAAFDLIACADTLCYFGDLAEVLSAAQHSLTPQGVFIFTVELAAEKEISQPGFRLQPNGRYRHWRRYIEHALTLAGLTLAASFEGTLRREQGRVINGLIVTGVRSAD